MSGSRSILSLAMLFTVASCATPDKTPEAAAATPTTVDPAALKDTIQAREREWSAAFLAGNAAGIAALYTEGGASIQATGDWSPGRAGIIKDMQAQFDTLTATTREDIAEEVIPAGDYALEIGHYSYTGTTKVKKAPVSAAGRYMVLWHKDADGIWRLHRDIGSEARPKKS